MRRHVRGFMSGEPKKAVKTKEEKKRKRIMTVPSLLNMRDRGWSSSVHKLLSAVARTSLLAFPPASCPHAHTWPIMAPTRLRGGTSGPIGAVVTEPYRPVPHNRRGPFLLASARQPIGPPVVTRCKLGFECGQIGTYMCVCMHERKRAIPSSLPPFPLLSILLPLYGHVYTRVGHNTVVCGECTEALQVGVVDSSSPASSNESLMSNKSLC